MENKKTFEQINKEISKEDWQKWLNHKSNKEIWIEEQEREAVERGEE